MKCDIAQVVTEWLTMGSPYQIESTDIERLNQNELPRVLNHLIRAEARLLHVPFESVQTSLRVNDPDGGIDARVRTVSADSEWLPFGCSVWQFKAQRKLTLTEMRKEVKKPGVRRALLQADNDETKISTDDGLEGGHERSRTYCLVLGGDPIPKDIERMRTHLTQVLASEYPGVSAKLFVAGDVAQWATEHPVMAFEFSRPANGVLPLERWRASASASRPVPP